MDDAGIPALIDAIAHLHNVADVTWLESVEVHEKFKGETVWEGAVQVFSISGHPSGATRAYAWSYSTEGTKRRFMAILGLGPVKDARTAVQAAIVADAKRSGGA